ncbi:cytosolic carboxypeptidase 2 [Cotesia typhae]|uniref:cytosolic carboxypeptidase 2 n=1 Tax=Cotesia typhae TaxID=2053667 RepID=UPI003D6889E5
MDLATSPIKELQAALFPVQPIPGGLTTQILQERFGVIKRDLDSLPVTTGLVKFREVVDVQLTDVVAQEPRWPTECKVIAERVRHIDYTPSVPEPYYSPTGREPKPKPINDEFGSLVFNYCPMSVTNYFTRSCIGGTAIESLSCVVLDDDLQFESRFESGNLGKVIKITDTYYQLYLRKDLYTQRHMQWFYFRISNTRSRIIYRLSIVNLCKEDSLYNEGLKPLLYSLKDASLHAVGWRRCGENISYYKNDSSDEEREKHTLTFNITFPHDQDTVYLAHCYPYTYSDLQEYLAKLSSDPVKVKFTKLRLLCRTLAGNSVHYLTITAPVNEEGKKKKGIVITARVHPGETPSSWMMKGIIDFLTGESNQARELRERFIFKLVPMLNPDGVIVGNNRCSLSGKDLNRQYRTVMRESYPSVWHTKLMIRRLMEECGIAMYCDLHAHSRKHNIFIYGCESKRACYGKLAEQIFPLMLHKNAADKFSFESCKFYIEKGKEGTSRVVVWLMGVQNSYTMEASMAGSKLGSRSGTHFSTQDYQQIGKAFCETLIDFSDDDPVKEKLRNKILLRLIKEGSSADEPTNINLTDYSSDEGDSDSSEDKIINKSNPIESEELDDDTGFLNVPPPSPQMTKAQTLRKLRKTRTKAQLRETYRVKRKLMSRQALDLPSTDPGSDMCCEEDLDNYAKLPDDEIKNRRSPRTRSMRLPVMRNNIQIKLTELRQQIWTTRVLHQVDGNLLDTELVQLAMVSNESKAMLKLCSKKLKSLEHEAQMETRKPKKKTKDALDKRSKVKRRTEENLQPRVAGLEALKLFEVGKLPKSSSGGNNKNSQEQRRKFRKSGIVAGAAVHVAKGKINLAPAKNSSSSSDEVPGVGNAAPGSSRKGRRLKLQAFSANLLIGREKSTK